MLTTDELFQSQSFFVEFEKTYLHGDILKRSPDETYASPEIVFLHAGGTAENRGTFNALRQVLLKNHDVSSCSFDFIGHGGTGGDWGKTTLQARTQQMLEVVDACCDCQPFSVVSVGLSAYTVLQALPACPVSNIVLMTPVLYATEFDTVPLSSMLEGSSQNWEQSAAWKVTQSSFGGNLTVISTTQDQVVLPETIMPVDDKRRAARKHKIINIPSSSHGLMAFANSQSEVLSDLAQTIFDTCSVNASVM